MPEIVLPARRGPVGLALSTGRDLLAAAGCDSPRLDAELLLAEVLGVGRERLVIDRREPLGASAWASYEGLLARRAAREPVAYILGRREFRHLTLAVDERVLIPRPETELLVEVGLEVSTGARVVDVGTGSGAVALACKHERPDLDVVGVDVSAEALTVARRNASRLGLEVAFWQADLLAGAELAGGVSATGVAGAAVLANLPYVPDEARVAPEIADYEPAGALFAGVDGLDVVRRLIAQVAGWGELPPLLALEIGPEQAAEVARLVGEAGFASVAVRRDLAGRERVVVGAGGRGSAVTAGHADPA